MDELLETWRADTPGVSARTHLNNAGAALMPSCVTRAITAHIEREALIGGYEAADEAGESVQQAYRAVAGLIAAALANVAIVENATVAFIQAVSSFDFRSGDIIVTTKTTTSRTSWCTWPSPAAAAWSCGVRRTSPRMASTPSPSATCWAIPACDCSRSPGSRPTPG